MPKPQHPGPGPILWFTVILPFLFFWTTGGLVAEWQTGEPADYVSTAFSHDVGFWFAPWFAFAAMSAALFWEEPERGTWVVRLGLWSGVVLSLQYFTASLVRTGSNAIYLLVPVLLVGVAAWMGRLPWAWMGGGIVALPFLGALWPIFSTDLGLNPLSVALVALIAFWAGTPLWSFLVYSHLLGCAIARVPRRPIRQWSGVGVVAWLAAYAATLAIAARRMEEVYARLPTSPPEHCYVATAAARGHRSVVGSWVCRSDHGKTFPLNRQLQILKAAERVLRERLPRLHRSIRAVYDPLGAALARRLSHPLLADLAYFSLKLPEGAAWCIVSWDVMARRPSPTRDVGAARRKGRNAPWSGSPGAISSAYF